MYTLVCLLLSIHLSKEKHSNVHGKGFFRTRVLQDQGSGQAVVLEMGLRNP